VASSSRGLQAALRRAGHGLRDLAFATASVELEGRVVQTIPVEFEANGGQAGVALELNEAPAVIRERIEKALVQ